MAHRFSDTAPPTGGNLTAENVNSLDVGLSVYVSPAGGLAVRMSPGYLWRVRGGVVARLDHAGQTSDLAIGSSVTTYLFVNEAGTLTANTTGFPDEAIVPVAVVVSGPSTITSITDVRPRGPVLLAGARGDAVYTAGVFYGPSRAAAAGTVTLTADTLYAVQFMVERPMSIDRLAVEVTTAQAASTARLSLYSEGAVPGSPDGGTKLEDSGAFATTSTGIKTATITARKLAAGRYWLVLQASDATVAFRALTAAQHAPHGLDGTAFSSGRTCWKGADAGHSTGSAAPNTFPATPTIQTIACPVLAVRAA